MSDSYVARFVKHSITLLCLALASCGLNQTKNAIQENKTNPADSMLGFSNTTVQSRDFYGVNAHRPRGALADQLFDKVKALGMMWVRIDVVWEDIEKSRGVYDWSEIDETIRSASIRGLKIYVSLHNTPKWANGGQSSTIPPSDVSDWESFCRAVVTRYDGTKGLPKIDYFGLWNEPDGSFFGKNSDSLQSKADKYADLILIPGSRAIRSARADARIVGPDLAHEPDFLSRMLSRSNAKASLDVISVHKYSTNPGDVVRYVDQIVSIMKQQNIFGSKPLWLTETGWSTTGKHKCWTDTVDPTTQASRSTDLLRQLISRGTVEKTFFYELMDDDNPGACQWGLLRSDRSEKPSFVAVKDFISKNAQNITSSTQTSSAVQPSTTTATAGSKGTTVQSTVKPGVTSPNPSPTQGISGMCKRKVTKEFSDGAGILINSKNYSGNTAGQCNTSCQWAGRGYTGCASSSCAVPGTKDDSQCLMCKYTKEVEEVVRCQ